MAKDHKKIEPKKLRKIANRLSLYDNNNLALTIILNYDKLL